MKNIHGFTLIELAVVLFIIALLLVGLLGPVATQIESRQRQETIETMNDIMEALYGFAIINRYLPCPDTTGDGIADPVVSGICTVATGDGWLPWQTLGINTQGDVWGNRFKYHVTTPGFTIADNGVCFNGATVALGADLDLCQAGDIIIRTRGDDSTTGGITEAKFQYSAATFIPAVVVSHGKNGLGATTVSGTALAATPVGVDENQNDDNNTDATFYSRVFSEGSAACIVDDAIEANILCQFDDIVMWISPNILMNRLIKAEVLP